MTSNYTDDNDMSLIDPVLAYMLQEWSKPGWIYIEQ
jgi:hypothetical protein